MTGDPYSQCVPSKILSLVITLIRYQFILCNPFLVKQGECFSDPECPDNRACIDLQCLDPCLEYDPCGLNAICDTQNHRAVCKCPSGWAGDPHAECFQCRLLL